jgi:osmotically-inducible protein OsmY
MPTDKTVELDIRAALFRDPRIPDCEQIAVAVGDGVVTLRGTVGSFHERDAAVSDARRIDQEYDVNDELQIRFLDADQRDDADIRGIALQALMKDVAVPAAAIDVKVDEGWVTIKGDVSHRFQSDAAFEDVRGLSGVVGATNEIRVITP